MHFICNIGSRLDWEVSKLVSSFHHYFFPEYFPLLQRRMKGDEASCHHYHGDRALISALSVSQGPIENDVMIHVALIAESQR